MASVTLSAGVVVALALSGLTAQSGRGPMQKAAVDPFLPAEIEEVAKAAAEAEHDPKRGPGNAIAYLKSERSKFGSTRIRLAIDLRIAAIALRQRFLNGQRFSAPVRHAQALATYSRLDLAEPGLKTTLLETLRARQFGGDEHQRGPNRRDHEPLPGLEVKVSILSRTKAVPKEAFIGPLTSALQRSGIALKQVPPKEAAFIVKLGARELRSEGSRRLVTTTLDLEQIQGRERVWSHSLFRTEAAPRPEAALTSGFEWLARIGGRDLLFRYLSTGPIPELELLTQVGGEATRKHAGHQH